MSNWEFFRLRMNINGNGGESPIPTSSCSEDWYESLNLSTQQTLPTFPTQSWTQRGGIYVDEGGTRLYMSDGNQTQYSRAGDIWQFSMSLIDKKIKNVVFHDSLKVGIAMILSLFLVTGVAIFFFNWVSPLWAILLTAGSTYGGICWFRLVDLLPYFWKQLAWFGMKEKDKDELSNQRKEIVKAIA